jgi:hypothetical protein
LAKAWLLCQNAKASRAMVKASMLPGFGQLVYTDKPFHEFRRQKALPTLGFENKT